MQTIWGIRNEKQIYTITHLEINCFHLNPLKKSLFLTSLSRFNVLATFQPPLSLLGGNFNRAATHDSQQLEFRDIVELLVSLYVSHAIINLLNCKPILHDQSYSRWMFYVRKLHALLWVFLPTLTSPCDIKAVSNHDSKTSGGATHWRRGKQQQQSQRGEGDQRKAAVVAVNMLQRKRALRLGKMEKM